MTDLAIAILVWFLLVEATSPLLLLPAWHLRHAAGQGAGAIPPARERGTSAIANSRALAFARRLRGGVWQLPQVTSGAVFVIVTLAALCSLLVAGNVLNLRRPELAVSWLPWLLGIGLIAVVAQCWPRPGAGNRVLGFGVVVCAIATVVLVSLVKVEATNTPPTEYLRYHPLRDALLGPIWVLLELALFLGGAALGHEGLENGVRMLAWLLGLALEAATQLLMLVVAASCLVAHGVLLTLHLLIDALFLPAAICWRALRRRCGTYLDGRYRLPALPGEGEPDQTQPKKKETANDYEIWSNPSQHRRHRGHGVALRPWRPRQHRRRPL